MPRQDVPYGGAICRLKERIAEIWDKLGEKLHSINGVEGDGAGDVKIVSSNAAVVINNDQIGHKIKVGLDNSKLPSAAVSSVNGKTGAVALNAGDIPSNGNSNVQADIDAEASARASAVSAEASARQEADSALQASIDAEAQARADADSALKSAINGEASARQEADSALQASIDAADAEAVKLTGDQSIAGVKSFSSNPKIAAPASGATDDSAVNANWVSQTGDSAPNNLIHKNGNETKIGNFTATALTANKKLRNENSIVIKDSYLASNTSRPNGTIANDAVIAVTANDNSEIMNFIVRTLPDGTRIIRIGLHDTATGANHLFNLITVSPSGTVSYPWS